MMMWLVLLLVLLPSAVSAETLYVRPEGGSYGAEDGTSYANAFDGFDDIVWGAAAGQLGAGDTLILCGTFTTVGFQTKGAGGSAGNLVTIDGDCSAQGDLARAVINMTGNGAAYNALSNGWSIGGGADFTARSYIQYQNIEAIGYGSGGSRVVNFGGTVDRTSQMFLTLDRVVVHITAQVNNTHPCIRSIASNVTITNSTIYDCPDDGIYAEGNNYVIAYNHIYNTDMRTDTATGDCIQFGGAVGIQNTGNWIHHNTLDHTNKATKQALIISGDSALSMSNIVEYNTMMGGAFIANFNPSGGIMRGNRLVGMSGTSRGFNVENQTGNNSGANTILFTGNIVDGGTARIGNAVFVNPSGTTTGYVVQVFNNTLYEFSTYGVRMFSGAAQTLTMKNNIVATSLASGTFAFSVGSLIAVTNDYNLWVGAGTKWEGGGAADGSANDINQDPQFLATSDLRVRPTSPARRAGTNASVICIDLRGRPCWTPPDIGAYQATSGDLATTRNTASTRSTATTRDLAATRTARD